MGPSSPRLLDHTGRGGLQTGTTHGQQPGLALCFHPPEQYNLPCALIRYRTPWHHDWWCTECQCMWLSTPTPDTEITTTHEEHVVFPRGLNGEREACHFSFPKLLPWDTAATSRSAGELPTIEVTLGGAECESMLTISHFSSELSSSFPWWHTGQENHLMRPWRDLHPSWMKDLLSLEEIDSPLHVPMATSPQGSTGNTTPRDSFAIVQVSHSLSLTTMSRSPGAASTLSDHQPQALARAGPSNICHKRWPWLQKEMNVALEQLLTMKAALDSHWRELECDLESTMQECEAQATRAIQEAESLCATTIKEVEACHVATIKEAEDCCTAQVHALQQSHRENILNFKHKAREKGKGRAYSPNIPRGLWSCLKGLPHRGSWAIIVSLTVPAWVTYSWPPYQIPSHSQSPQRENPHIDSPPSHSI